MKKLKRFSALLMAVLTLGLISLSALAAGDYGSTAVEEGKTYTLEQMLTYAIEDEYLAYSQYSKIINEFGAQRPFTNILRAEENHINAVKALFEAYGFAVPEYKADEYTTVPASLLEAAKLGVTEETENIAMYEGFLKQELPEDVKAVFNYLIKASQNHLRAFQRSVDRLEGNVTGNSSGGRGRAGLAQGSGSCDGSGTCQLTPQSGSRGNSGAGGRGGQQRAVCGSC
jgi:hypothetical protein